MKNVRHLARDLIPLGITQFVPVLGKAEVDTSGRVRLIGFVFRHGRKTTDIGSFTSSYSHFLVSNRREAGFAAWG